MNSRIRVDVIALLCVTGKLVLLSGGSSLQIIIHSYSG